MANRREFIQACIAASAAPSTTALAWNPAIERTTRPNYFCAIFDERFPESVAFGEEVVRLGESARSIKGDITQLWFSEIDVQWRKEPMAIAGLTSFGPLFCLERWGWDADLRVVFLAEHSVVQNRLQHKVSGPPDVLAEAQARLSGTNWATQMARLAFSCRHEICTPAEISFPSHNKAFRTTEDEALFSWVIAPVNRANQRRRA
jgi:hypothetical protein